MLTGQLFRRQYIPLSGKYQAQSDNKMFRNTIDQRTTTGRSIAASADSEERHDSVCQSLNPRSLEAGNGSPVFAHFERYDLGDVQIVSLDYGTEVTVEGDCPTGAILALSMQRGAKICTTAGKTEVLRPGSVQVTSSGIHNRCKIEEKSLSLTVRWPLAVLERHLAEAGLATSQPLVFTGDAAAPDFGDMWNAYLINLTGLFNLAPSASNSVGLGRRMASLLSELLLTNCPNSYSASLAPTRGEVLPGHVRRARDAVHYDLTAPLSTARLARAAGVSIRALQAGFRSFLGMSPQEYVRQTRLEHLHHLLITADETANVTSLMLDAGIVSFGRYAHLYEARYGKLPSETLRCR